jgi:hypothetical protein
VGAIGGGVVAALPDCFRLFTVFLILFALSSTTLGHAGTEASDVSMEARGRFIIGNIYGHALVDWPLMGHVTIDHVTRSTV